MLEKDPVVIRDYNHLKAIGEQMKAGAEADDSLETYSKTTEEAVKVSRLEGFSKEDIERLVKSKGNRAIFLNGVLISLVMSQDDHHGHQWHLSMCQIVGPGKMIKVIPSYTDLVCGAFFLEWKPVPNPGKMTEILHFVGND